MSSESKSFDDNAKRVGKCKGYRCHQGGYLSRKVD